MAIAFGIEAFTNFIGSQVITDWKERQPFRVKLDQIYSALGSAFNENNEPYQTICTAKKLRDSIAHGQPIENVVDIRSTDELWVEMSSPWDHCLDEKFVNAAYNQVRA